ncbi:MAG: toxin-antitoxin system HicB family antitoxin [Candidatus Omnitrophica bacterium]|nr:toxin-antitoxin system HicB family antitoxin [Candidatus Omnitrophota bacterium]
MKKQTKKIQCLSETPCKGHLTIKKVNYTLKHNGKTIIVPEVEIWKCDTCGKYFYPYETSQKIDLYKEFSGRLMLRIDPKLHYRLIRLSKKHHRSLNQEITYLLENAAK